MEWANEMKPSRSGTDVLELVPAGPSQRNTIANLMQLYLHDLSGFEHEDVDDQGRYAYDYLDNYWKEAERHPFLFVVSGKIAGFALVREVAQAAFEMAEFFVMRKYRRRGLGTNAARKLFERFPGTWRIAAADENEPAISFWRGIVDEYTRGSFTEERSKDGPIGPRFVFTNQG